MKKFLTHVFRPGTGRTVPSASCRVKVTPSTSGSPNATVYSDSDGLIPIAQPFLANSNGMVEFYAPDGRYDLYFSIPDPVFGTISYAWTDISIADPQAASEASSAINNSHFVVTQQESLLPNEIVMPTFRGHPDTPPLDATSFDNEWDSLGAWSSFNTDSNSTLECVNGRLRVVQAGTTRTNPAVGVTKAFTESTYYIVTALLRLGYHPGVDSGALSVSHPLWGLGLRTSLGEIVTVSLGGSTQGISVYRADYNSGGLVSSNQCHQIGSNACYVRIVKDDTYYLFEWSQDGFTYTVIDKLDVSSLSGTVNQIGLFSYANFDSEGSVTCYADFTRVKTFSSFSSLGPPSDGTPSDTP